MHHLQLLKTLAALAAAGFNPRAFLAPMAFGDKPPKPVDAKAPPEPDTPAS